MIPDWLKILLITPTIALNFLLGILVLLKNPRSNINRVFFLIGIMFGIWALCLLFYEFPIIFTSWFWIVATYMVVTVLEITILAFSFIFPGPIFKKARYFAITYSLFFIFLTIYLLGFTDYWVVNVVIDPQKGLQTILGKGYIVWTAGVWILIIWSVINFIFNMKYSLNSVHKAQLRYLMIGFFLYGMSCTIADVIIPLGWHDSRLFSVSTMGSLFFSFSTAYVILRHRFLDIRLAAGEVLEFLINSALLFAIGFVSLMGYFVFSGTEVVYGIVPYIFLAALLINVLYDQVTGLSRAVAAKLFSQSAYDAQEILKKLSHSFSTVIDLEKLADVVVSTMVDVFKINRAGVLAWDVTEKHYDIEKTVGFNESNGISHIRQDFLTNYLQKHPQIIVLEELSKLKEEAQEINEREVLQELENRMKHIEAALIVPVVNVGQLVGLIVLGEKKSNDPYTVQDINMLNTVASEASVAFENAILFNQLSDLNQNLLKKVDEKTLQLQQNNEKLSKANVQLQSLDKMKDQLVAVTSHELKTPVSIALNYLWMVINQQDLDTQFSSKDKIRLEKSMAGLKNLVVLINDILDVSRIEGGKLEVNAELINPEEVISNVMSDLQPKADQKGLKVMFTKPNKQLRVYADSLRLKEVLTNLIGNAIKYTDKGGVTIFLKPEEDNLVFVVADTGHGIAKEDLPKLFQKFYREDGTFTSSNAQTGGTGLGLYITKSLVELMKGKIWVESSEGHGSTFYFSLGTKMPSSALKIRQDLQKGFQGVYSREEYIKKNGQE